MAMKSIGWKLKSHDDTLSRVVTKNGLLPEKKTEGNTDSFPAFISLVDGVAAPEQEGGGMKSTNW